MYDTKKCNFIKKNLYINVNKIEACGISHLTSLVYLKTMGKGVTQCMQKRPRHYPGVDTLLFTMAFLALRCFCRCFNFFAASFAFDIWLIVCPLNAPTLTLPGLLWRLFGPAPFFPPVWSIAYNLPDRLPDTFALSLFFVLPPSKLLMLSELPARRRFPLDTCMAVSEEYFPS